MSEKELKPCPFCGHVGLSFEDGSTYRWGLASCAACGATAGEVRRNYPPDEAWHKDAIAQWNTRATLAQQAVPHSLISDQQYLEMFMDAKAGSDKPAGYLRGIRRVIAAYEAAAPAAPRAEQQAEREPLSQAAHDVLAERQRQISAEGWTPEHDDEHADGAMALAAGSYCESATKPALLRRAPGAAFAMPKLWPMSWDLSWWRPKNPRADLVRAGALILAEIERLDRAHGTGKEGA